jgi:hypothetical protein
MAIAADGQGPKGDIRWLLDHGDDGERAYCALVECAGAVATADPSADISDHITRMRNVVSDFYNGFAEQSKKPKVDAAKQDELLGLAREVADFFYGNREK